MISIAQEKGYYHAVVFNEFTLQDFREFEQCVMHAAQFDGKKANLLIDLRDMVGYTLDMALEEIRFSREHRQEIARIALLTTDQWVTWSAWVSRMITEAEIEIFDDTDEAVLWLKEAGQEPG